MKLYIQPLYTVKLFEKLITPAFDHRYISHSVSSIFSRNTVCVSFFSLIGTQKSLGMLGYKDNIRINNQFYCS